MSAQLFVGSHWYMEGGNWEFLRLFSFYSGKAKAQLPTWSSWQQELGGGGQKQSIHVPSRNSVLFFRTWWETALVSWWVSWHWVWMQCSGGHPHYLHFVEAPGACWRLVYPCLLLIPPGLGSQSATSWVTRSTGVLPRGIGAWDRLSYQLTLQGLAESCCYLAETGKHCYKSILLCWITLP